MPVIEKASATHCKDIINLAKEGGLFNYTALIYSFLIYMGWAYIIFLNREIVGYITYLKVPIIKRVFILQISITERCRGKGLGARAFEFLETLFRKTSNITTLVAHTLKPRVVKLFKRQNWVVVVIIFGIVVVRKIL